MVALRPTRLEPRLRRPEPQAPRTVRPRGLGRASASRAQAGAAQVLAGPIPKMPSALLCGGDMSKQANRRAMPWQEHRDSRSRKSGSRTII